MATSLKSPRTAGKDMPCQDDKCNILIVDDRPENHLAFETILAPLEQTLVFAKSGRDALRELLQRRFAVILLDINMPVMDGYQTAELVRQRSVSQYTPIIFVTAGGPSESHIGRGYALGAVDYLFSPVDPNIVRAKVSVFIDLAKKETIISRQGEQLREAAERRAERAETTLQALLNTLDVGVYRATPRGRLLTANPAFLRLFKLSAVEDRAIEGIRELRAEAAPTQTASLPALLGQDGGMSTSGAPSDHELEFADGTRMSISVRRTMGMTEKDEPCIEGIVADISERKAHERLLRASNLALMRANEDLNQFAYAATHDVQEPLRMVATYSGVIAKRYRDQLDPAANEFLDFIIDGARRMDRILSDLLLYAELVHSNQELAASVVPADKALDNAIAKVKARLAEARGVVTRGKLPSIVMQDGHLEQLFENLLDNAIKYRRGEPPAIHVAAERVDNAWQFSVRDNGLGIPKEHHERLFGVFQRFHGPEYPGTGIGLAICSRIVQRYGGEIWVESDAGAGSTFYFTAR